MKKGSVIALLTIAVIGLTAANSFVFVSSDRKGPEIKHALGMDTYYAADGKTSLLDGVTAVDDRDGDVSETLRVESVLPNEDNSAVTVTYAAKDSQNNVTKKSVTLAYSPSAKDEAEGTLTEPLDASESGITMPGEDFESQATQSDDTAISQLPVGSPEFRLKTHLVTIPVGSTWHYYDYIASISDTKDSRNTLSGSIVLSGGVDTSKPGTYEVVYHVTDSDGNDSNYATLTVIVE